MEQVTHPAPPQPVPREAETQALCLCIVQHPSIPRCCICKAKALTRCWGSGWGYVQPWCFTPSESPCLLDLGTGGSEDLNVLWIHTQNGGYFSRIGASPSALGQLGDLLPATPVCPWHKGHGQTCSSEASTFQGRSHSLSLLFPSS